MDSQDASDYRFSSQSGVSPIEAGYGLLPVDTIVATTTDELRLTPANRRFELEVNGQRTSGPIAELGLAAGEYHAELRIIQNQAIATRKKVKLILVDPARVCRLFGARYGALEYDLPVIVGPSAAAGSEKKVPWASLWRTGGHPDIIVDFEAPYKFVLWRGMAYAPSWAMNNVLTSNFFAETIEPGVYRDCCEMMSDRECRYSHARVIHSSAARAVIHWRYALCDPTYTICRNYWVDELFYIYPDGVAVRNVTLYLDPHDEAVWQVDQSTGGRRPCSMINCPPGKRCFNDMEFITVNAPGATSEQNTPREALTLLDGHHFSQDFLWPNPPDFARTSCPQLDSYIFRINYRDRPGVFLASAPAGLQVRLQNNVGMRYVAGAQVADDRWVNLPNSVSPFSDYIHWPITRGYGTTPLTDPREYRDRPTQTFLGFANNAPVEVRADGAVTWSWLSGMAPADESALRATAMAWLVPPPINGARYNARERAYLVHPVKNKINLTTGNQAVINPTFLVPGLLAAAFSIKVNGTAVDDGKVAVGVERVLGMSQSVVTIRQTILAESTIQLQGRKILAEG